MQKKDSIVDIAKKAKVSIATVSRVINGNKGYSEDTKQRVLAAIKENGYRPNGNAVCLRTLKSYCIGVIVPDITNEFFASIVRELEDFFISKNYTLLICDSNENVEKEDVLLENLIDRDVDAIIYISGQEIIGNIKNISNIPVVYIDRRPRNVDIVILSDNETGGYLATKELINKGCKRIVLARDSRNVSTVIERKKGYLRALKEANIEYDMSLELFSSPIYEESKQKTETVLRRNGLFFDGAFCTCDMMALGFVHGLNSEGYSVPSDVKVVGFDDVSASRFCYPPITTVAQDTTQIALNTGKVVLNLLEKGEGKSKVVKIPVSLKIRGST